MLERLIALAPKSEAFVKNRRAILKWHTIPIFAHLYMSAVPLTDLGHANLPLTPLQCVLVRPTLSLMDRVSHAKHPYTSANGTSPWPWFVRCIGF